MPTSAAMMHAIADAGTPAVPAEGAPSQLATKQTRADRQYVSAAAARNNR